MLAEIHISISALPAAYQKKFLEFKEDDLLYMVKFGSKTEGTSGVRLIRGLQVDSSVANKAASNTVYTLKV